MENQPSFITGNIIKQTNIHKQQKNMRAPAGHSYIINRTNQYKTEYWGHLCQQKLPCWAWAWHGILHLHLMWAVLVSAPTAVLSMAFFLLITVHHLNLPSKYRRENMFRTLTTPNYRFKSGLMKSSWSSTSLTSDKIKPRWSWGVGMNQLNV